MIGLRGYSLVASNFFVSLGTQHMIYIMFPMCQPDEKNNDLESFVKYYEFIRTRREIES